MNNNNEDDYNCGPGIDVNFLSAQEVSSQQNNINNNNNNINRNNNITLGSNANSNNNGNNNTNTNNTRRTKKRRIKKSSKHRKRHIVPGPAGELYQLFMLKNNNNNNDNTNENTTALQHGNNGERVRKKKEKQDQDQQQVNSNSISLTQNNNDNNNDDESLANYQNNPAWKAMCIALNRYIPFIPLQTTNTTDNDDNNNDTSILISKCYNNYYKFIRKHIPNEYILINEIHSGKYDVRIPTTNYLIVSIVNIYCHAHCDWTCDLRDESTLLSSTTPSSSSSGNNNNGGNCNNNDNNNSCIITTTLTGWLEGRFVKDHPEVMRPGCVLNVIKCIISCLFI